MPNTVKNTINMDSSVWSGVKTQDNSFDFNTLIPMPSGTVDVPEWRLVNWGTTSNAENVVINETNGLAIVEFDTEYSVPFPIFSKLTDLYPNHTFTGLYIYPDGTEYDWEYVPE